MNKQTQKQRFFLALAAVVIATTLMARGCYSPSSSADAPSSAEESWAGARRTGSTRSVDTARAASTAPPQADAPDTREQEEPSTGVPPEALPTLPRGRDELRLSHTGFTVSYNTEWNQPNWVAWELTQAEAEGAAARREGADFLPDEQLPAACQVTTYDYRGSGYDRGHQCPAADMRWSPSAMSDCFLMSNMCPQEHALNAGPWATLEKACRRWAGSEGAVLVCCGPLFEDNIPRQWIGRDHRVAVPTGFFKVVMSLRPGHEKAIAFTYENSSRRQPMEQVCMSVDQLERATGFNFFSAVPRAVQDRIEARCNLREWR